MFWVHRVCSLCPGRDVLLSRAIPSAGFLVENRQVASLLVKQINHLHADHVDASLWLTQRHLSGSAKCGLP